MCDYFHEFRALFNLRHQWERKAYAAIGQEDEVGQKFARAPSESHLEKRLHQYEKAHQACEQAIARYDQLDILLQLLRETLQVCSPEGKLRAEWWELLSQQVKSEEDAKDPVARSSKPPLPLRVNNEGHTDRPTVSPGPATLEHTGASENELQPADAKAA